MSKSRIFFDDYVNHLFHLELKIIKNSSIKLHEKEKQLFDSIYNQVSNNGIYQDDNRYDKRIKNRLKNKIENFLTTLDTHLNDKQVREQLAEPVSFANISQIKKTLRKLIKRNTGIETIHSFLIVLDELRDFFFKVKEQTELKLYYEQLESRMDFINYNLGASYFLRELDLDLSKSDSLNLIERKVKKINEFIKNPKLIDGYKFKMSRILCQHKINTGEWKDAKEIACYIESEMEHGRMYSKQNLSKLFSFLIRIYSQTYEEGKYKYYLSELDKSQTESDFLEKQVLDLNIQLAENTGHISKETLNQIEKLTNESKSERIKMFLRIARTDYYVHHKEYNKAKSFNDIFFVDIHNTQVREFLDRIYIQRFLILYYKNQFEDIISLFENKITQRRIHSLERKGKLLIYPYIIYDIARYKQSEINKEMAFKNIYRMLDFYHYNNFMQCYSTISHCIALTLESIPLETPNSIKLKQLSKIISETLDFN